MGATSHWVAVPRDRAAPPVQCCGAFPTALYALAAWLRQWQIAPVVMASTGGYWMALFAVLDERGFDVKLVAPHSVRQGPGRTTAGQACQWLHALHPDGFLRGAFRAEDAVCVLRRSLRQRRRRVAMAARAVQPRQQAREPMPRTLTEVVSDSTGKTGMTMIRALRKDARDSQGRATHRDTRCTHEQATRAKAVEGHWRGAALCVATGPRPVCV